MALMIFLLQQYDSMKNPITPVHLPEGPEWVVVLGLVVALVLTAMRKKKEGEGEEAEEGEEPLCQCEHCVKPWDHGPVEGEGENK